MRILMARTSIIDCYFGCWKISSPCIKLMYQNLANSLLKACERVTEQLSSRAEARIDVPSDHGRIKRYKVNITRGQLDKLCKVVVVLTNVKIALKNLTSKQAINFFALQVALRVCLKFASGCPNYSTIATWLRCPISPWWQRFWSADDWPSPRWYQARQTFVKWCLSNRDAPRT